MRDGRVEHVRDIRIRQPRMTGSARLTDQLVKIQPRIRSSLRERLASMAQRLGVSEAALVGRMIEECLVALESDEEREG